MPGFLVILTWFLERYWDEEGSWIAEEDRVKIREQLGVENAWIEFGRDEVHNSAVTRFKKRRGNYLGEINVSSTYIGTGCI